MSKYIYKSAIELAELIKNGDASSLEIVQEHLARIKQCNADLNAVILSFEEEAVKIAKECDLEIQNGHIRGPLHGVPMTIKEQFWLKGTKSTINFNMLKNWVAPEDAVVISRLKSSGAIIMGKTNIPKGLTDYQVSGDIYPEGKNPYNQAHSPGGSSGGSAAALASGMTPIELGGDFGGSIRNPSNFCGLYGLKPTENTIPGHGSVPQAKGAKGFIFHMALAGPMARNMHDLELVWKIIRGPHKGDRTVPRIDWENSENKSINDFKIAWVDGWPDYPTSSQTKKTIQDFVEQLQGKGCQLENLGPAGDLHDRSLSLFVKLFGKLISQDLPWFIKPFVKRELKNGLLKGIGKYQKEINNGFNSKFIDYSETMGIRAGIVAEWETYFEKFDLLICPMSFGPAYKRCKIGTPITYDGQKLIYVNYVWPYTACFNASGHPGINIPLGLNEDGLPIGVQVVGPYWSEPDLIQFGKLVSNFTPGFIKPEGY